MASLRFYTFINFYLSSIQQGIQSAHVIHEAFVKHQEPSIERDVLYEWATNHKTIVVLNGGINADLKSLYDFIKMESHKGSFTLNGYQLPWSCFNEDSQSLSSIMTGVGIVLPEEIFDAVRDINKDAESREQGLPGGWWKYVRDPANSFCEVERYSPISLEARFLEIYKSCGLAR